MSKIQTELVNATGVKVSDDRQKFLHALVMALSDLDDKEYDALSEDAQAWSDKATAAVNSKAKALPDFPDYKEPEPAAAPAARTRRRAAAEPTSDRITKVGDMATIVTKPSDRHPNGKTYTGEVVEALEDETVLLVDGTEVSFPFDRIKSCTVHHGEEPKSDDEPEAPELGKGDMAVVTSTRGKVVTGEIVELTDDIVVIDDGKVEHEFQRNRVASMDPVGGKAAAPEPAPEPAPRSTRTRATAAPALAPAPASEGKPSVGSRIKELLADNLGISFADVCKALKKEGIEFREATAKINYADMNRMIDVLRSRNLLTK